MESPGGLLSLKWNNHTTTFTSVLSNLRNKNTFSDALIACEGKLFYVHKLVLSTCSEYFQNIFESTDCKRPVIVLKDIKTTELDALLNYMYIGEVNVLQTELAGLINAAECLRIKGLAVPDDQPTEGHAHGGQSKKSEHGSAKGNENVSSKRVSSRNNGNSPPSKRLKRSESSKFVPEFKESIDKSKHSSHVQRTSDCKEVRLNNYSNSANKNQQMADTPSNSSSQEVVLLDNPDPVKSEAVSPKLESEDCYDSSALVEEETCNSEGLFGSDGGTHHSLDDIMATVGAASQVHHSGNVALHGEPDTREELSYSQQEQQQYEPEEGQGNMVFSSASQRLSSRHLQEGRRRGQDGGLGNQDSRKNQDGSYGKAVALEDAADLSSISDSLWDSDLCFQNIENEYALLQKSVGFDYACHSKPQLATKKCPICFMPFSDLDGVCDHVSTEHSPNLIFKCNVCEYKTLRKDRMETHNRIHTGEKPYACIRCPYKTADRSNFKKHLLVTHRLDKTVVMAELVTVLSAAASQQSG